MLGYFQEAFLCMCVRVCLCPGVAICIIQAILIVLFYNFSIILNAMFFFSFFFLETCLAL